MMISTLAPYALGALAALTPPSPVPGKAGDLLAIRVGKAESIAHGTLEHAVILVENGRIVTIGEDLPIERGIPVLDLSDWVAMPGLVNCHSRIGLDRSTGSNNEPHLTPRTEVYPRSETWRELLELGVTTIGLVPAGSSGIPGQALVVRPHGETVDEMVVADKAYLKIHLQANSTSKKALRDAFEKVDKHNEKVEKAREKWEKDQEKKKKSSRRSRSKKDDDEKEKDEKEKDEKEEEGKKGEDKKEDEDKKDEASGPFEPPVPDPKIVPFIELREGRLTAMMSIKKAAGFLHLLDALGDEEINWFLQNSLRDDIDTYEVAERIGERELLVVTNPRITLQVHSRRERNIPAELARAGAKIAFIPLRDTLDSHREWMSDVGFLVSRGLPRDAALAAVTHEAARALGLDEELGSLDEGKQANIVFWDGDPLEPASRIQAVMLEGRFVVGEVER